MKYTFSFLNKSHFKAAKFCDKRDKPTTFEQLKTMYGYCHPPPTTLQL